MTGGPRWRVALAALALGCAGFALAQNPLDFSAEERRQIAAHGPWPPPVRKDLSNRVQHKPAAVRFGRRLFFDAGLVASGGVSCASCHVPARAFQDGVPVAQGRSAAVRRNTPSLLDTVQQRWWGWDGAHDSLWSASLAPLLDANEMGGRSDTVAARVRTHLVRPYRAAFGRHPAGDSDEIVVVSLAKALAAFQSTLVSARTPFDDFRDALLRGDRLAAARYPLDAQRGLRLFIGSARCSVCHAGPTFSNREFADIGMPFFVPGGGVDPGRHGGLTALLASRNNRLGPHNDAGSADPQALATRQVVQQHRNFGEFKVPGLRQLAQTAPYMHNGSLATIEDVVRHYSELNEDRLHADGERILRRLDLTAEEAADLAAFLRSLSGQ